MDARQKLMRVDDVFELADRVVLAPGVDGEQSRGLVGRSVSLERPDGTLVSTTVASVELPSPNPSQRYPIALGGSLTKQDVPIGTEVWLDE